MSGGCGQRACSDANSAYDEPTHVTSGEFLPIEMCERHYFRSNMESGVPSLVCSRHTGLQLCDSCVVGNGRMR